MKRLYVEQQLVALDRLDTTPTMETWPQQYKVRKVTGSTVPRVHAILTEAQVQEYCANVDWHVEVT